MDRGQLGLGTPESYPAPRPRPPNPASPVRAFQETFSNRCFRRLRRDVGPTGVDFDIEIDSHGVREDRVRGVPHTGEGLFGRPCAEVRITGLRTSSPLLDPENTGALAIFVFRPAPGTDSPKCRIWICRDRVETDVADDLIGPVEPGLPVPWGPA